MKAAAAAQDWYVQAAHHIKEQRFDQAKDCLERSLAVEETAKARHDLGIIHYMHNRLSEAAAELHASIKLDPAYDQAYANLSRIMFESGNAVKAIEYSVLAVSAKPTERAYKEEFIQLVKMKDFKLFYPQLKSIITQCLETEDLFHEGLVFPWFSLLKLDPSFAQAFKFKDHHALLDPFFLAGLRRLLIPDLEFENFISALRRGFLEGDIAGEQYKPLLSALATYCHYTGYIMEAGAEEQAKIKDIRARIESGDFNSAALYACYAPLGGLKNAAEISSALKADKNMTDLARIQIDEPLKEREIAATIRSLTKVEDGVSKEVQAQYETYPYPRWKSLNNASSIGFFAEAAPQSPEILVAGCGTGQEVLNYAQAIPGAKFTAVDLSRASLSYAIRKAQQYGAGNIEFLQADILALGALDRKFDLITSSGVLHHMRDPAAGWKVLVSLLKLGGMMRIALYSEIARRDIVAARKVIAEKEYPSTDEGIRAFRKDFPKLVNKKQVDGFIKSKDFYSMPACRDLLFHVQEHRFEIPQIEKLLKEFGLEFIKFDVQDEYLSRFRQKYKNENDLSGWAAFEKANPDIFAGMYEFWCRKT